MPEKRCLSQRTNTCSPFFFFPQHDANIIRLMDLLQWLLGRILMGCIQMGHYHPVKTIRLHSRRITLMLSLLLKKNKKINGSTTRRVFVTERETEHHQRDGGERGGGTEGESKSWREKGKNRGKDHRPIWELCTAAVFFFFFVLAAVQYAVPFVGQQKVQCSLLL